MNTKKLKSLYRFFLNILGCDTATIKQGRHKQPERRGLGSIWEDKLVNGSMGVWCTSHSREAVLELAPADGCISSLEGAKPRSLRTTTRSDLQRF